MKMKYGLILAAMLSTSVMAQVTNTPPPMPDTTVTPPAPPMPPDASTNKPPGRIKKAAKKKKAATKAAVEKKEKSAATNAVPAMPVAPFTANELAEAKQDHVNIRGQAHINSEVIGHLKKGEAVTVLEEVTLKHPKADEPAKWARIALPADMHVWVMSAFIDKSNQVVSVRKLNLRTGAGENYSVIGLLHKGDAIKLMNAKGGWTEIEAPTNAFAFVAAHLLKAKEAAPEPVATPMPPPVPTVVGNQNTITPATAAPGTPEAVPNTASAVPLPPIPAPAAPAAVSDEPLPKRIVDREGVVGGTFSIQAPTYYELRSLDNGRVMDYLYTTSTNVMLKNYKGMTIHVSGEEELDERWPNTPVITIQRIQVVK